MAVVADRLGLSEVAPMAEALARNDGKGALLLASLEVAVPLWQMRVRSMTDEQRTIRGSELSQHIAEHGDIILYQGPKKGDTAAAFNALAEGLAIASFAPGGVTFMGRRWIA